MARVGQRWKSPRYKHKTAPRPKNRYKCRFYKPKRVWTAKAAARAVCAAIQNGASRTEVDRAVEAQCGRRRVQCDCERIRITLKQVLELETFVLIVLALLQGLTAAVSLVVLRRIPFVGSILGRALSNRVVQRITNQADIIEGTFFRVKNDLFEIERELIREVLPRG